MQILCASTFILRTKLYFLSNSKRVYLGETQTQFMTYMCNTLPSPDDCILDAVLTVSPNRQYRGILFPTTPAQQGPGVVILNIPTILKKLKTVYSGTTILLLQPSKIVVPFHWSYNIHVVSLIK